MPTYVDLLKVFEESTKASTQVRRRVVLELPRPLEEIFPEVRQEQHTVPPLSDFLKKDYEHLVTAAFTHGNGR